MSDFKFEIGQRVHHIIHSVGVIATRHSTTWGNKYMVESSDMPWWEWSLEDATAYEHNMRMVQSENRIKTYCWTPGD